MKRARKGGPRIEERHLTNEAKKTLAQARHVTADVVPPPSREA